MTPPHVTLMFEMLPATAVEAERASDDVVSFAPRVCSVRVAYGLSPRVLLLEGSALDT